MTRRPRMTMPNTPHHAGATALLAALALAAIAAVPASATAPASPKSPTFALSAAGAVGPPHLRGVPGRVLHGEVLVRNVSPNAITVRLQAADIRNAANGNADYVTAKPSGAGRWVRLAAGTVHLESHAVRRVGYTVRIPRGTGGATHYAGIVAIDAADLATAAHHRKSTGSGGFSFSRVNRQALPLTIRLPGRLMRSLALHSLKIVVRPVGAGLVLGLRPGGTVLIQSAPVKLRVLRGRRTVFSYASTIGQLFPDDGLDFRIAWKGRPTKGSYRVVGVIRPKGAAPVYINQTIVFSPARAAALKQQTVAVGLPPSPGMPMWVWLALSAAATLLVALSLTVWKLKRRPAARVA
jgi:hypothetical protein